METNKTLEERVKDLEYVVYRKYIEECPRCHQRSMNALQKDICTLCAYKKGESMDEIRNKCTVIGCSKEKASGCGGYCKTHYTEVIAVKSYEQN